jgi:hypothetical protein
MVKKLMAEQNSQNETSWADKGDGGSHTREKDKRKYRNSVQMMEFSTEVESFLFVMHIFYNWC